jgi:hypothetical protein
MTGPRAHAALANAKDADRPFQLAIEEGQLPAAAELLELKASVNAANSVGRRPSAALRSARAGSGRASSERKWRLLPQRSVDGGCLGVASIEASALQIWRCIHLIS